MLHLGIHGLHACKDSCLMVLDGRLVLLGGWLLLDLAMMLVWQHAYITKCMALALGVAFIAFMAFMVFMASNKHDACMQ